MAKIQDIPARTPLTNRRVMFCDNNKSKFSEITRALDEAGIEVLHVADKSDVVPGAMRFQPDLVLINLFMSSANTLSTMRELKGVLERQGTKIIALTSHQSKENITECIRSGASDFIIEPFNERQMLQRIKYQLQDREAYSPDDLRAEPTQVLAGFQLVYDCLRIISELKDPNRILYECVKRSAELALSPRVNIVLADVASGQAAVIASSDDEKLDNLIVDIEKYPEVREVCLKGSIVYVKDITQNPLTKDIKANLKDIDITSLLVFPIRHRGETLGTLSIRLGVEGIAVSDKHLKTFYMMALAVAPKVAARKLLKKMQDS
jgi:CheY-like chemotaxis protein